MKFAMHELYTLPNLLSSFRLVSAPILLWMAWTQMHNPFLLLLAITFSTDILDGFFARLLNQTSKLGAFLDSLGDIVIYITLSISIWLLWPDLVKRELLYVLIMILSYLIPVLVGFIKFQHLTSYHTWLVKVAVAAMGVSFFLLTLFDLSWPFRTAAVLCALAAIEEIAITLYLSHLKSDVRSIFHLMKTKVSA
jgi:CDP-diacylglycerol--glycerol-3-phosphate 3-phosphatidyltransferase